MALKCVVPSLLNHFWSILHAVTLFVRSICLAKVYRHLLSVLGSLFCSIGDLNWPRKRVWQALKSAAGEQSDHVAVRRLGRPGEQQWWAVNFISTNWAFLEGLTKQRLLTAVESTDDLSTLRLSPKLSPIHMGHSRLSCYFACLGIFICLEYVLSSIELFFFRGTEIKGTPNIIELWHQNETLLIVNWAGLWLYLLPTAEIVNGVDM